MELNRRARRARERQVKKDLHRMVCMFCGGKAKDCTDRDGLDAQCPECDAPTKLMYKKDQQALEDGYPQE